MSENPNLSNLFPRDPSKKQPEGGDRRTKGRRRVSSALSRIAERSLDVDDADVRAYQPTELDVRIAEAMLGGAMLYKDIATNVGVSASKITELFRDQVRCAWISEQLQRIVRKRIGLVDLALVQRALSGDVRAMDLFYKRMGEIVNRSVTITARGEFDPSQLTDEDLAKLVKREAKKHVIDVPSQTLEDAPESTQDSD